MCRFVQPDGSCKYGPSCKYLHPSPSLKPFVVDLSDDEDDNDEEEAAIIDEDVQQTVQQCVQELQMPAVPRKRIVVISVEVPEAVDLKTVVSKIHESIPEGKVNVIRDSLVLA